MRTHASYKLKNKAKCYCDLRLCNFLDFRNMNRFVQFTFAKFGKSIENKLYEHLNGITIYLDLLLDSMKKIDSN